jgi:hypothetical protein
MTTSPTSSARHFAQLSCHAMRRTLPVYGQLSTTFFASTHASSLASPKIPCTIVLGRARGRAGIRLRLVGFRWFPLARGLFIRAPIGPLWPINQLRLFRSPALIAIGRSESLL